MATCGWCDDCTMARLTGQRVVIRSLRLDDLEPVVMGRTKLAEQGSLTDHPDYEHLRAQLPHWSDLRDGRVNLGVEVDGRLVGEIQTFQPVDRPAGPAAAVCEVGLSLYDAVDRGRGLGAEAMQLFVDWLFGQGVEQVQGSTAPTNLPMRGVFERVGFTREYEGRSTEPKVVRYRLRRPEEQSM